MPKKVNELSAVEIRRLSKPGRYAVGGVAGLLLSIKETGAKSWVLRTMVGGKRRNIGLGGFPDVSIAVAREKARQMKEKIAEGVDPVVERQARKARMISAQAKKLTFAEAARLYHEKKVLELRNEKHKKDWISSLERHAMPIIGAIPVSDIEFTHILKILDPIWAEKTETATRVRQRLEAVLTWATVSGYRSGENPARWRGHLEAVLPKPSKLKSESHFPALPWQEIGAFMADLRKRNGSGPRCLEFIILTAVRSGEARLATWNEIDFKSGIWTIPAERMKARKEHRVPLCDDALSLLNNLPRLEGSDYVFPGANGGPLSDMTVSMVCRRMKINAVPHGFRSTFRDWAAENTNFPREVAEMALAHTIDSSVEAAYRRGDLLEKRKRLMDSWSDYCSRIPASQAAKVTPIRKSK
jgi:integrase